jgi:hypothetical protein
VHWRQHVKPVSQGNKQQQVWQHRIAHPWSQHYNKTNKSIGLLQCAGEQSQYTPSDWTPTVCRGAVTCCQHGAECKQQSIGSPGVGDSFSFRKETTISHSHPLVFSIQPYKAGASYACRSVLEEVVTGGWCVNVR